MAFQLNGNNGNEMESNLKGNKYAQSFHNKFTNLVVDSKTTELDYEPEISLL